MAVFGYSEPMNDAQKVDVMALAALARVAVSETELAELEKELPAILGFVNEIQAVGADLVKAPGELYNVMRDDVDAYEPGMFTEDLLRAAPLVRDNRVEVHQMVKRTK